MSNIDVVEINITDNCTRSCAFCPHATMPEFSHYNTRSHDMSRDTIDSLASALRDFSKTTKFIASFAGFGEPLLGANCKYAIEQISPHMKSRVITNFDALTVDWLRFFNEMELDELKIDLYDNVEQLNLLNGMLDECPFGGKLMTKKVYENEIEDLPFFNQGGHVDVKGKHTGQLDTCLMPLEHIVIDWTGDYLLCCADWGRDSTIALANKNIKDVSIDGFLKSDEYINIANHMKSNNRNALHPCKDCNIWGGGKLIWE